MIKANRIKSSEWADAFKIGPDPIRIPFHVAARRSIVSHVAHAAPCHYLQATNHPLIFENIDFRHTCMFLHFRDFGGWAFFSETSLSRPWARSSLYLARIRGVFDVIRSQRIQPIIFIIICSRRKRAASGECQCERNHDAVAVELNAVKTNNWHLIVSFTIMFFDYQLN